MSTLKALTNLNTLNSQREQLMLTILHLLVPFLYDQILINPLVLCYLTLKAITVVSLKRIKCTKMYITKVYNID